MVQLQVPLQLPCYDFTPVTKTAAQPVQLDAALNNIAAGFILEIKQLTTNLCCRKLILVNFTAVTVDPIPMV